MNNEDRVRICNELLNNMDLTKEQYIQTCLLLEELDCELVTSNKEENEKNIHC